MASIPASSAPASIECCARSSLSDWFATKDELIATKVGDASSNIALLVTISIESVIHQVPGGQG